MASPFAATHSCRACHPPWDARPTFAGTGGPVASEFPSSNRLDINMQSQANGFEQRTCLDLVPGHYIFALSQEYHADRLRCALVCKCVCVSKGAWPYDIMTSLV